MEVVVNTVPNLSAWSVLPVLCVLLCAAASRTAGDTTFVPGFAGEVQSGEDTKWHTHLGYTALSAIRQQPPNLAMKWKSAAVPPAPAKTVTFVWTGAVGAGPSPGGNFTLYVNGRAAADFDVAVQPTRFLPLAEGCELVYDVVYVYSNSLDSSGYFYLSVPADWVRPGEPAALEAKAKDIGSGRWFGLMKADDAPLSAPDREWAVFKRGPVPPSTQPSLAPPPDEEASYEWYLKHYGDMGALTTIGPPADPSQVAVSPTGQIFYGRDIYLAHSGSDYRIPGTFPAYVKNGLAFALCDESKIVPVGSGDRARQSLVDGYMPMVITSWKYGGVELRETAFCEPMEGKPYRSGTERTLAWAGVELVNSANAPRDVALLAFHNGDDKDPKWDMAYRDGAVLLKGSALFAVQAPAGFTVEFSPVFPADVKIGEGGDALQLLRARKAVYNALVVRGQIPAGGTVRVVFNRVFDFPGTIHVRPKAQPPVAAGDLTARTYDRALGSAKATWRSLAQQVSHFKTPDASLDRIVRKAMLDGYFLTKRWDGRRVVFDSIPSHYLCQWDDASTKWFYALDLMGDHKTAELLLDTVFERQAQRKPAGTRTHEGCFSDVTNTTQDGSPASWTSCNGWALWAMTQHARLTSDRKWIEKHKSKILAGCEWIIRERSFSKKNGSPTYGLIGGKFVCDLPGGEGYFAYQDAISYLGLHSMARLLSEWGHPEAKKLLAEAEAYRKDIVAAIDRLTDRSSDPWYVPWFLNEPKNINSYMYDIVGPINLAFGGVLPRDDERIGHVIRWIMDRTHGGSPEATATAGMFYSQDLAVTLLELDRVEDFLRIFYTLLAADISHETLTTGEWAGNTQPHVHSVSSLVRMFRTMLIQERDGSLDLLQGTPRRWLANGSEIKIDGAPTWYGPLSLHCVSRLDQRRVTVKLVPPERIGKTPVRLRLRLPEGMCIRRVSVNGRPHKGIDGEWIVLRGISGATQIECELAPARGPAGKTRVMDRIKELLKSDKPVKWLFAGDSITHGALHTYGSRDYVQIFEERLRWELQRLNHIVIKTAVSGWSTQTIKENIEWNILQFDPDVVSIMIGMNDAGFVELGTFTANYRAILDTIAKRSRAVVILHTPNPLVPGTSGRDGAVAAVAQRIRELGAERGLPVIDNYAEFQRAWKEDSRRVQSWMADSVHPNAYGHRAFARLFLKELGIWDETSPCGKLEIP
jgi:lysophospholipase L1-like esterase